MEEAKAYLKNDELRKNYRDINEELKKLLQAGKTLKSIFVSDRDVKIVKESLTLFYVVAGIENRKELHSLIKDVLDLGNNGRLVQKTVKDLGLKSDVTRTNDISSGHDFAKLKKIPFKGGDLKKYLKMWISFIDPEDTTGNVLLDQLSNIAKSAETKSKVLLDITDAPPAQAAQVAKKVVDRSTAILALLPLVEEAKEVVENIRDNYTAINSIQRDLIAQLVADSADAYNASRALIVPDPDVAQATARVVASIPAENWAVPGSQNAVVAAANVEIALRPDVKAAVDYITSVTATLANGTIPAAVWIAVNAAKAYADADASPSWAITNLNARQLRQTMYTTETIFD